MRSFVTGQAHIARAAAERWRGVAPVLAVVLVGILLLRLVGAVVADVSGTSVAASAFAYDFVAYYDAAMRLIATGSPYQSSTLGGAFLAGPQGLYLYSPVLAVLALPFTALQFHDAATVYVALQLLALLAIVTVMPVSWQVRVALLAVACVSPPVGQDLNLGNVSLLVTLGAVVAWRYLDRPLGSVALVLSAAVRPTMGLFVGWWLVRRRWRPVAWFAVAGAALVFVTLPFVGVAGWLDYLTVLRNLTGFEDVYRNFALNALAVRHGQPDPWPAIALFAGYASAGVAVLWSLRRDRELSFVVTVGATLLLSPLLWDHYMALLLVPAAFLASRRQWWGMALPLLCYLAQDLLPFVALLATALPLLAPAPSEREQLAAAASPA